MANENLAGRTIAGYRLLERVGEGGTAEVYRAEHPEHNRCAFKVLRPRLRGDPTAVKRFLRGASYGARVQHPGVGWRSIPRRFPTPESTGRSCGRCGHRRAALGRTRGGTPGRDHSPRPE